MAIPTANQRHLRAPGMRSVRITHKGRSDVDSAVCFRHNAITEYVQITSYDSRLPLSWAVLGFPKAKPLLRFCKEVEFDLEKGRCTLLVSSAKPNRTLQSSLNTARGQYLCVATAAWARRHHRELKQDEYWHLVLKAYKNLSEKSILDALTKFWRNWTITERGNCLDEDMEAAQGAAKAVMRTRRRREAKLRPEKIRQAMANDVSLHCKVPGCGFDFKKRFGNLGFAYAEAHHKTPVARSAAKGRKTRLGDLATVCANCHRMIHRGGVSRPLKALIKKLG